MILEIRAGASSTSRRRRGAYTVYHSLPWSILQPIWHRSSQLIEKEGGAAGGNITQPAPRRGMVASTPDPCKVPYWKNDSGCGCADCQ